MESENRCIVPALIVTCISSHTCTAIRIHLNAYIHMHVKMHTLTILCMYSPTLKFTHMHIHMFTHVHTCTLIHTHGSHVHIHIHMYIKYLRDLDLLRLCHSIRPCSSCLPVFLHCFHLCLIVTFNKTWTSSSNMCTITANAGAYAVLCVQVTMTQEKRYTNPLASTPSSSNPFSTLLSYKPLLFVGHAQAAWDVQAEEMTSDCHDLSLW